METYDSSLAPQFRRTLAQREAELRAILSQSGNPDEEAGETGAGEVQDFKDVAMKQAEHAVSDAQAEHAVLELEQVLAASRRLQNQSYGQCLDCGDAINLQRLATLPATPYCTSCQTVHEHMSSSAARI